MAPKCLPPELLFEIVTAVPAEAAIPNLLPSCRLLSDFLLPRVVKWKEIYNQIMEELKEENIILKKENQALKRKLAASSPDNSSSSSSHLPAPSQVPSTSSTQSSASSLSANTRQLSVWSRLTMPSKKYKMSIEEVKRRMSPPESMRLSDLVELFRKGKGKNHKLSLQKELKELGIEFDFYTQSPAKAQAAPKTSFTCMSEAEAIQLANDFGDICRRVYPTDAMASHLRGTGERVEHLRECKVILETIKKVHREDCSPNSVPELRSQNLLAENIPERVQSGLTELSALTHGFGGGAFNAMLQTIIDIVGAMEKGDDEEATKSNTPPIEMDEKGEDA